MSAYQHAANPDNDYLLVSQTAVADLLDRLAGESPALAHFRFRDACGYEANPRARAVRTRLMAFPPPPVPGVEIVGAYMQDGRTGVTLREPYMPMTLAPPSSARKGTRSSHPMPRMWN